MRIRLVAGGSLAFTSKCTARTPEHPDIMTLRRELECARLCACGASWRDVISSHWRGLITYVQACGEYTKSIESCCDVVAERLQGTWLLVWGRCSLRCCGAVILAGRKQRRALAYAGLAAI